MTGLSQKIFDNYQVRRTKKQKLAFIELLKNYFPDLKVEEVSPATSPALRR